MSERLTRLNRRVEPKIRLEPLNTDFFGLKQGDLVSRKKIWEIFGEEDGLEVVRFITSKFSSSDKKEQWNRFCVSKTASRQSDPDDHLIYFELKKQDQKNTPDVIFLGAGKPPDSYQVFCGYAAETLGYKFLGLGKE